MFTGTGAIKRMNGLFCFVRQQCDLARTADGVRQAALVTRACARHSARKNLEILRCVTLQCVDIFIVDMVDVIRAKNTIFLAAKPPLTLVASAFLCF